MKRFAMITSGVAMTENTLRYSHNGNSTKRRRESSESERSKRGRRRRDNRRKLPRNWQNVGCKKRQGNDLLNN